MRATDGPRTLVRRLVLVNGAVPFAILAYDASQGQLGANGIKFAIHTTGLLALLFFVASLAVTPLKRLTGWSELVAARRALGLYGFFYLALHFGIFFAFDREASVSATVHEILTRRYLQIGTVALLLFTPLAITSTDGMITRLGPRRWKRIHRVSYVATSLGALHYVLQTKSKSDLQQPLAFAGVLGVLLGARVLGAYADRAARAKRPKPWSGELRVARITEETHDVRTFRLALPGGGPLPFAHRAGQYLNVALQIDGERVPRSYTIASAPTHRDYCEITVKKAADGWASRHLHETLAEGALVKVSAPAGRFVFEGEGGSSRVLLVAGGVGITPLMAMVRTLTDRAWRGRIDLVYSVKTRADIVFERELADLTKRFADLHVTVTLTREPADSGWTGERGPITRSLLERVAPNLRETPIYLCGPEPMMAAMMPILRSVVAPSASIRVEAFVSPPRAVAKENEGEVESEHGVARTEEEPARGDGSGGLVQFATSGASTSVADGETLLEAAESLGVDIPFDCRSGICGQCKTRLVKGRVVMEIEDALTADDRKRRLVLACQARPVSDVVVDA